MRSASVVLLVFAGVLIADRVFAEDGTPVSGTAFAVEKSVFAALSPDEQRKFVADAYRHRLSIGRNLRYENELILRNYAYRAGVLGEPVNSGLKFKFRRWLLADAYRTDTDLFGEPQREEAKEFVQSGFNRHEAIGRATIRYSDGKDRSSGRLSVREDMFCYEDRIAFWLDGEHNMLDEFLFRYLLDRSDTFELRVPDDGDVIQLTVPWQVYQGQGVGAHVLDLDPLKGFLPVHGRSEWRLEPPPAGLKACWRIEEFFVDRSQRVVDVWMPTSLREILQASTAPVPGHCSLRITEVTMIEHGTVTPEDLVVSFTEGMLVVDEIQGIAYTADRDGAPVPGTIEELIGANAVTSAVADRGSANSAGGTGSPVRVSLLVASSVLLIAAVTIVALTRRKAKRQSVVLR